MVISDHAFSLDLSSRVSRPSSVGLGWGDEVRHRTCSNFSPPLPWTSLPPPILHPSPSATPSLSTHNICFFGSDLVVGDLPADFTSNPPPHTHSYSLRFWVTTAMNLCRCLVYDHARYISHIYTPIPTYHRSRDTTTYKGYTPNL